MQCVSRVAVTIGTSAAMRVYMSLAAVQNKRIPKGLWCYRITEDKVLLGGALTDGGSMYEWMSSLFSLTAGNCVRYLQIVMKNHHYD